eukprot:826327-Pyramimonas_sp.AAC.1
MIELFVTRQGGGLRRHLDGSQSYFEFAGWLDTDAGHIAATGASRPGVARQTCGTANWIAFQF